ncbi:MAG: ATP-binding protein [Bacteroidota bacterium]
MSFKRLHFNKLKNRLEETRVSIQTIVGPRQIGKTTLVNQLLDSMSCPTYYVSADAVDASNSGWVSQQWEMVRLKLKASKAKEFVFALDEIQKIENWGELVKAEWDKDSRTKTNIKVILLGSSRLLLQKGFTESLAGRYELTYMGHWTLSEMQEMFGFSAEQYAWFGGYPGSSHLLKDENRWKEYITNSLIEATISKDILMLSQVNKPALLKRLFELGCIYSSQILSFNKILGQLHDAGNTTTLSHYLELLDTAGMLAGLKNFNNKEYRKRSSSPKFQVYNTALISSYMHETFDEIKMNPAKWGRIVESVVGAHLVNYSRSERLEVYYWRHRNDEIDFVLKHKGKTIGLEIKGGFSQKATGMEAFRKKYNPDKVLLIGDSGLPWQEFLKFNPVELF